MQVYITICVHVRVLDQSHQQTKQDIVTDEVMERLKNDWDTPSWIEKIDHVESSYR